MTATLIAPVGAHALLDIAWDRQAILSEHLGTAPATALDESQKAHIVGKWSKDRAVTEDLLAKARGAADTIPRLEQRLAELDYLTGHTDHLPVQR
ncbi:hypothetical protein Achl_4319 (plasmid) [Pseudarthrobacter chlorophenolicus A6]|uniref:Uncharacterized protein n=1 Tax=Pseudarthrobacter chlorophenolicus (strain ATCC 700700 / DSM 12829 / CIP 107037 / JCM 12360 / KCTC 9906 / NCIMB 13794 / A6) TaxID=452863 RepID=B8HIM3_PSECP|nr:hypothetical protein [Pseudarthrobacter chlorophenolicus]ACL42270.1 hypothetical protein Achl_4319 [Pseudarthrobacter chlorophenolicus A6]